MNNLTADAAVGRDVSKSLRINSQASTLQQNSLLLTSLSLDVIRRSKRKKLPFSQIRLLVINNRHFETGYVPKFITDLQLVSKLWKDHYFNLDSKPYSY